LNARVFESGSKPRGSLGGQTIGRFDEYRALIIDDRLLERNDAARSKISKDASYRVERFCRVHENESSNDCVHGRSEFDFPKIACHEVNICEAEHPGALLGVEPAYGFLPSHQYASGAELSAGGFVDLRIEAEVAFKMGSELGGPDVTATSALSAVESALPAFELLDFIYSGTPRAADYVANSIHGQAVVLGNPLMSLQGLDLASEEVLVENNSEFVGTYTAADVMGNPLNALAWLANQLASRGRTLKRGDIVISGGISKLLRPKAGDFINATFTHLGSVAIKVVS
jgi:2-keto-4-pentenoate hydratase